jgi:hypothetical protein
LAKPQELTVEDKILGEYLPQFFSAYPKLKNGHPSLWFAWSDCGKLTYYSGAEICHASMGYMKSGFDHLVTAVPKTSEVSLDYLRMLIRGPFRAYSHLIHLKQSGDKYYFQCDNLAEWPANVLYNFCIATRIPIEHEGYLTPWKKLCDDGYDSTLAFLLAWRDNLNAPGVKGYANQNHLWVDTSSDWSLVVSGQMVKTSTSFKDKPLATRPTNCIWGYCPDAARELAKMSPVEIAAKLNLPIVKPEPIPEPPKPKPKKKFPAGLYQGQVAAAQNYAEYINFVHAQPQAAPVEPAPVANPGIGGWELPPGWGQAPMPIQPEDVLDDIDDDFDDFPEQDDEDDEDDDI